MFTANFFPIKSVGNPRVTRGTPYYTHNYHGDYLLPENPRVSHSRTHVDIALKNMYTLHVNNLEFTGKSPQILQNY